MTMSFEGKKETCLATSAFFREPEDAFPMQARVYIAAHSLKADKYLQQGCLLHKSDGSSALKQSLDEKDHHG